MVSHRARLTCHIGGSEVFPARLKLAGVNRRNGLEQFGTHFQPAENKGFSQPPWENNWAKREMNCHKRENAWSASIASTRAIGVRGRE